MKDHSTGYAALAIHVFATRSLFGAIVRTLGFLAVFTGIDMLQALAFNGHLNSPVWHHARDVSIVGLPFVLMALWVLSYLDALLTQVSKMASTDILTGLPNRRAFMQDAVVASQGRGVLLMLDVDFFKKVNDSFGHDVGDTCLSAVGAHLREVIHSRDLCARLGGEEFVIFLSEADLETAKSIAVHLCAGIALPVGPDREPIRVTLSAGGCVTEGRKPLNMLMSVADEALYAAKAAGRTRAIIATGAEDVANCAAA